MKIDDHNFIQQLHLRNEAALMYVIDEYGGLIKAVIRKNMSCLKEYQEECMNDVLLSIWENIESYHPEKNSFKNCIAIRSRNSRGSGGDLANSRSYQKCIWN